MPKKPNSEKDQSKKIDKFTSTIPEGDADDWSNDQKKKSYYYDDSHGYEIYNPNEDDDDLEDEQENPSKK